MQCFVCDGRAAFIAQKFILEELEAEHKLLFVTGNLALCYFVAAWFIRRVATPESYEDLTRFYTTPKFHEAKGDANTRNFR